MESGYGRGTDIGGVEDDHVPSGVLAVDPRDLLDRQLPPQHNGKRGRERENMVSRLAGQGQVKDEGGG